jgi:hypothetical protein
MKESLVEPERYDVPKKNYLPYDNYPQMPTFG